MIFRWLRKTKVKLGTVGLRTPDANPRQTFPSYLVVTFVIGGSNQDGPGSTWRVVRKANTSDNRARKKLISQCCFSETRHSRARWNDLSPVCRKQHETD